MVSDEVRLGVIVDVDDTDIDLAKDKLDAFVKERDMKLRETYRQLSQMGRVINLGVRMARNFARAMGRTLDASTEAILTLISSSVTSMISIAAAFTASTLGIGAAAGAIMAAAAIGLNIGATASVLADQTRMRDQMDGVIAILADLGSITARGI